MDSAWIAMVMGILILVASMLSVELGISVALIEIVLGVVAANSFGLNSTPWIDFLAGFGSIVLTFSVLITVVVLSAIVPTWIAQRSFQPALSASESHKRITVGPIMTGRRARLAAGEE